MKTFLMMVMMGVATIGCNAQRVYNILDFGAGNDTTVYSTAALQQAIDLCSQNGGGQVLVPKGGYKIGSIELRSHVDLHLDEGATLYGSTSVEDYRPMKTDYVSLRTRTTTIQLIYADNVEDVQISGTGTIDGRGRTFPKLTWNDEGITRPHLLRFIRSRNIRVSDVHLVNSGCWMQHYLACDDLEIRNIKVVNRNNYNNDALDLDGCHRVKVCGMVSDSDDDGITLKSTSPRLCEDIEICHCDVSSHCNAIKLGTETNGGFRNIRIHDITVHPSPHQESRFFGRSNGTSAISLEIVDGGVLENVEISNVTALETESPIFIRLGNRARSYSDDVIIGHVGQIRNVRLSDICVTNAGATGSSITGLAGHPVENILLENISITQRGGVLEPVAAPADEKIAEYPEATMWGLLPARGFYINHARNVTFRNVKVESMGTDVRPFIFKTDAQGISDVSE